MIYFDEQNLVFKLDTQNTSYIMGVVDGYLGHIYYGRKLQDSNLTYLLRTDESPKVPSVLMREKASFMDAFPMEYSFGGIGDFRESCICIQSEDGQDGLDLTYKSHRIYQGKNALEGLPATWGANSETLEITMEDKVTGLQALLMYSIFSDSDAVTRSVRVINNGCQSIQLLRVLSACLEMDMEGIECETLTLHGTWAKERNMQRTPVGRTRVSVESKRGISSHQDHPFIALMTKNTTQTYGEVYAMNFVYSGNFMAQSASDQFGKVRTVMGIHPEHFCWKLNPGDSFQAPEVVMVYSDEGLGKMTRTFHSLYRRHLIRGVWKEKERPVLINNWEATYFDFNTDKLLAIAEEAAKSGIEMLVMDDGWFGHRQSDDSSLGDWFVNENKINGGLKYLVDEVNKLGLKFGIWIEPEMISPDSELYQAHPDWAFQLKNRVPSEGRGQLVLDLSRPEVVDNIYGQIKAVLSSANIEYVKWDMNRPLTDVGNAVLPADRQGELSHRYMLAVYEMQRRLTEDFPNLLLENCASGGARFDPGMLFYSPQIWCSDDTDAIERLTIQEGTHLIYPLSTIGAHVSDCPNHTTGRVTPFETRGIVALAGTFGYELDITKIPEKDRAMIPEQIAMYKKYNEIVREGEYYRLASYQENHFYDCYEIVSPDQKKALITYVQVLAEPNQKSRRIRLQGLKADAVYEINGKTYMGDTLMNAGLLIQRFNGSAGNHEPWGNFQAALIYVEMK